MTRRRPGEVVLPLATASAIWYGLLVWIGAVTEQNLDAILAWLSDTNRVLLISALVLACVVVWVWFKTRGREDLVVGTGKTRDKAGEEGAE